MQCAETHTTSKLHDPMASSRLVIATDSFDPLVLRKNQNNTATRPARISASPRTRLTRETVDGLAAQEQSLTTIAAGREGYARVHLKLSHLALDSLRKREGI